MQIVGPVDVVTARVPLVQVDATKIDHPHQRRKVLDHWKIYDVPRRVLDMAELNPVGPRRGRTLHKKEVARCAIWIALHHHGAICQMRQQERRNVGVVLEFSEIREFYQFPIQLQLKSLFIFR